jgi:hypothetical protein
LHSSSSSNSTPDSPKKKYKSIREQVNLTSIAKSPAHPNLSQLSHSTHTLFAEGCPQTFPLFDDVDIGLDLDFLQESVKE